ncbi:MAG: sporulation sigma factor SigE, partial [Acutalibacteraceae bacterium]|nr:sporulation sigma factor SigE [Acutalibacteraceae bacterium]
MTGFIFSLRAIWRKIKAFFTDSGLYYINGPDLLPEPLDAENEAKMLKLMAQGDNGARDELIVHNLRLVVYIA